MIKSKMSKLILVFMIINIIPLFAFAENEYWPYSTNTYSYTKAELEYLAKTIDCVARGESIKGKVAVGNVIMNRVFVFNSNITSIVTAANQFTYNADQIPTSQSYEAARRVLNHEEWEVPQNCYYFKTTPPKANRASTWSGISSDPIVYWGQIGNHHFYVRDLAGRYNGNDIPAPMFARKYDSPRLGIEPSDEIIYIQELLIECGYTITPNGYFGALTHKAVKDFQKKNDLPSDGIVGEITLSTLEYYVEENLTIENPDDLFETPVQVKQLLKTMNDHMLIKNTIDHAAIQYITIYRINQISDKLRNDYGYSMDTIRFGVEEEKKYLSTLE